MKFPELTYATEDDPRWKQWAIRSVERLSGRNYFVPYYETWQREVIPNGGPIIGFHLCGPWASELLTGGYYAVNWEATPEDVGHLIHAHPSLSELVGETMITFSGRSLHG